MLLEPGVPCPGELLDILVFSLHVLFKDSANCRSRENVNVQDRTEILQDQGWKPVFYIRALILDMVIS